MVDWRRDIQASPNEHKEYPQHQYYAMLFVDGKGVAVFWGGFMSEVKKKARDYYDKYCKLPDSDVVRDSRNIQ